MTEITFDAIVSKYSLPTWRVRPLSYPGNITLEATPWRGKFRRWLEGVSRPLDWRSDDHPSWEEFSKMKHYRTTDGIISASGVFTEVVDESRATPITDEAELHELWREQLLSRGSTEVSAHNRSYIWRLPYDSDTKGNACVHFSWFWEASTAKDDEQSVTVTFKPSLLAQLRHLFLLKPFTMTVYAPQGA